MSALVSIVYKRFMSNCKSESKWVPMLEIANNNVERNHFNVLVQTQ